MDKEEKKTKQKLPLKINFQTKILKLKKYNTKKVSHQTLNINLLQVK